MTMSDKYGDGCGLTGRRWRRGFAEGSEKFNRKFLDFLLSSSFATFATFAKPLRPLRPEALPPP